MGDSQGKKTKWYVHEDPNFRVQGFKIGDTVRWGHEGPRYTVLKLLQMVSDPKRWYAYVEEQGNKGNFRNLGLDYLSHLDVVDRLAEKASE